MGSSGQMYPVVYGRRTTGSDSTCTVCRLGRGRRQLPLAELAEILGGLARLLEVSPQRSWSASKSMRSRRSCSVICWLVCSRSFFRRPLLRHDELLDDRLFGVERHFDVLLGEVRDVDRLVDRQSLDRTCSRVS
jgi:hypothetical protein